MTAATFVDEIARGRAVDDPLLDLSAEVRAWCAVTGIVCHLPVVVAAIRLAFGPAVWVRGRVEPFMDLPGRRLVVKIETAGSVDDVMGGMARYDRAVAQRLPHEVARMVVVMYEFVADEEVEG